LLLLLLSLALFSPLVVVLLSISFDAVNDGSVVVNLRESLAAGIVNDGAT